MNGKDLPNDVIIYDGLFNLFENAFDGNYIVKPEGEVILGLEGREKFSVYPVESKGKNALNPFKHKIF